MAAYGECFTAVQRAGEAAGRELSTDEIENIFQRTHGRMRRHMREGMDAASAAERAGQELGGERRTAALIEKRNAALNLLRKQALDARAGEGTEARDVRAVLTGVEGGGRDDATSIGAVGRGLHSQLLDVVTHKLRKAGLFDVLYKRDKVFERDLAREMWRLDDPTAAEATGNKHAADAAAILHEGQERGRLMQNEAGAWIGKEEHYITRQSHDMLKVRGKGPDGEFAKWRDEIAPKLDDRTFDALTEDTPAAREGFLKETWRALASGVHDTAGGADWLSGFKGSANLGKKASQERKLHFRSADDWFDYNEKFGKGAVVDSVLTGFEHAARNTAVMKTLGTNPRAMFEHWVGGLVERAKKRDDFGTIEKLKSDWNGRILDQVTGEANIPGHTSFAKITTGLRVSQQLSKLGSVLISSLPDLTAAAATLRHNGVGLLEAYGHQITSLLPGKGAARREVADHLAVGLEGTMRALHSRFRGEEGVSGWTARKVDQFHRWNGLTWWTDNMKDGMGEMLSYNLARNAGKDFTSLAPRLQTTLRRYGIEGAEWDAIRGSAMKADNGRSYIFSHAIEDEALATKLQTYFTDQVREGMSEPTEGIRAMAAWGTKAGTVDGEIVRTLMQFKTFTATFMTRSIGRELGRYAEFEGGRWGASKLTNTWRALSADPGGLAHMIVMSTALGYVSMTLKELAKGRNPRQPENAGGYFKLLAAAAVQGGGLGIYGDFLFGDANRMGGGMIGTFFGPTVGTIEDAHRVYVALRDGITEHGTKEGLRRGGVEAFQMAKNNAPFLNLFYSRMMMDYLVLHGFQEWMNPGYLRRYEARIKKENNQTFWLRPSQYLGAP